VEGAGGWDSMGSHGPTGGGGLQFIHRCRKGGGGNRRVLGDADSDPHIANQDPGYDIGYSFFFFY